MKAFNKVVEEESKEGVAKLFELTIDCKLVPKDIEDALTQAMHKAALAILDEAEKLAWDYIVTATREESWSRTDLKLWLATLRKQLTDKE